MNSSSNRTLVKAAGTTLLEVILACVLIVLVVLPIYKTLSTSAVQEIDTTKLSIARKILESLRQEMSAHQFTEVTSFFPGGTAFVDVGEVGIPETVKEYIRQQQKYKDFQLKMFLRFTNSSATVIECKGEVEWTGGSKQDHKKEEILFLLVKP